MTRATEIETLGRPTFERLEPRWLLAAAIPSAYDQYMVELINWARANPANAAAYYGVLLNEGLAGGTISTAPKQPLAINPYLTDSAQGHTAWMFSAGTLSHTGSGGSAPVDRMVDAGYVFGYNYSYGENIAATNTSGTTTAAVAYLEQLLFVDSGVSGRAHRLNLMEASYREVGVGVGRGLWDAVDSVVLTQDFAYTDGYPFLTGVVYDDTLVTADNFYTPGEGIGAVQVTAVRRSDHYSLSTTTWASGGYSLALPAGTYDVTISGGGLGSLLLAQGITLSATNVKLDYNGHVGAPWTLVAPFGGLPSAVIDVDVDPANSQHILLSTRAGIYTTSDGGAHWSLVQAGMVRQLAFDPNTPGTLYAVMGGDTGGVLKSTDNGGTWTLKTSGLTNRNLAVLAVASAAPGVLFVGEFSGGNVWRSLDGGDTWARALNGKAALGVSSDVYVTSLQVSADGKTVYALLSPTYYNTGYLFRSLNTGANWTAISTPVNGSETALAIDPTDARIVYLGAQMGFYRSPDSGTTWSNASTGLPAATAVYAITVDAQNTYRVYVGVGNCVYYTSAWGDSWLQLGAATTGRADDFVWSIAVDPGNPLVIYAAVDRSPLPATRGEEEGVYRFTRTAPGGPFISITWSGGTITDGQVAPVDFGTVNFGATAPSITFTVHNTGDEPLILSSLFPAMDHFTSTAPLSTVLRPGQTTTFTLTLKTTAGGAFTQAIAVDTNDADLSPFNFTVSGTVVQPDLTGHFPSQATALTAVPGDQVQVPLVLTDAGTGPASGTISVALYASTDPGFGTSLSLGAATRLAVSLSPGDSKTYYLTAAIPGTMTAGSYYLRAVIDSTGAMTESDETNNVATTDGTKSVAWRFGAFDGRRSGALVLTNGLGQSITFSLSGAGYCDVTPGPHGYVLEYTGTDAFTTTRITPAAGAAVTLDGVTVHGNLGQFIAPAAALDGDLAVQGTLGLIQLGNVTGVAISITAAGPTTLATSMTFGRVIDTRLTTNQPIGLLTATDWISSDPTLETITAPSIAGLLLKTAAGATGSLQADLWLTGAASGATLGKAAIAGNLAGHWDVAGAAGSVVVRGTTDAWDWGADGGSLVTTSVGAISLRDVGTASVVTTGSIGPIKAVRWQDGLIEAARGSTLRVTGATGISGDFGADLILTDGTLAGARPLMAAISVAGWLDGSTIRSAGPLGAISCLGMTASAIYVGLPDDAAGLPTNPADFSAYTNSSGGPVKGVRSLTVRGVRGSATRYFIDSYVSAWMLGNVTLRSVDPANADPDNLGGPLGVSAHTIAAYTRDTLRRANLTAPGAADSDGDFVIRII